MKRALPNILWLMTDEQRTDSLGLYGSSWAVSPHLNALARDATVFRNAYTPAPVCMAARLSLLSGKHPCETGVWGNEGHPQVRFESLLEPFHEAGYASATFGKQHYGGAERVFGTERGFVVSEAVGCYDYNPPYRCQDYGGIRYPGKWKWILGGTFPEDAEKKRERQAVRAALEWLENLASDTPFLLRLSFSAPHTPVVPPPPFDTLIPEAAIELPPEGDRLIGDPPGWLMKHVEMRWAHLLHPEEIRRMRRFYYGETAFVDHAFGILLDRMRETGRLENTIIAFVSDHGTHLGDQDQVQKGTFFETNAKVPYFIRVPDSVGRCGRHIETPVGTITLLPTLIDLAGLELPTWVRGLSLKEVILGRTDPSPEPVYSEIAPDLERLVMVRDGRYKLMMDADDESDGGVLVDLDADPLETRNLYRSAEHRTVRDRLERLVRDHLAGTGPIQVFAKKLERIQTDPEGRVICPTCKNAMGREVRDPRWTQGFARAYQCQHCGQRFGVEPEGSL